LQKAFMFHTKGGEEQANYYLKPQVLLAPFLLQLLNAILQETRTSKLERIESMGCHT